MAEVKLPLNLRREERDTQATRDGFISKIKSVLGDDSLVFDFNFGATYAKLTAENDANAFGFEAYNQYLESLLSLFEEKVCKLAIVKTALDATWKSPRTIKFVYQNYDNIPEPKVLESGLSYCMNFDDDGKCLVVSYRRFWCNTHSLRFTEIASILTASSEGSGLSNIPVALATEYADKESRITNAIASVRTSIGDDSIQFECNYNELYKELESNFSFEAVAQYVEYFATCIKKSMEDDMVKEAVLEAWTDRKFTLSYIDMEGLKYASQDMNSKYNGVRFIDGRMDILVQKGSWWTNTWYLENTDISILL